MKVVAIIQARMGSTRLPGKVMKEIKGKTILDHVVTRVKQAKEIDEIVVATTIKDEDDTIVEESKKLGVDVFRGSENNVLSRYYNAAKENNADVVVRITSDCPLIDPEIIDNMICKYKELYSNGTCYLSNTIERTFPRGLDTEVFSFSVLEEVFKNAKEEDEREHVTPYIYKNPSRFKLAVYKNEVDYSNHRWTLDTPEDLKLITKIYEELYKYKHDFYFKDIIKLFEEKPSLFKINKDVKQKI